MGQFKKDIILLDTDQPTTCPLCGARTDFVELSRDKQKHTCLNCKYEFIGEFEPQDINIRGYDNGTV